MLKICVVTGSRAEYGLLKNLFKEIQAHPQIELQLVVTGAHLVERKGLTVSEIEREFPVAKKVPILSQNRTDLSDLAGQETYGKPFARGILGFTQTYDELLPDWVVVTADRYEMLAAALSAFFLNIPLAHIAGGEASGTHDNSFRHAITRFAHLHFAETNLSSERLKKMGEDPRRIFMVGKVGSPEDAEIARVADAKAAVGITLSSPYLLVDQHPDTFEAGKAGEHLEQTLKAVKKTNLPTVLIEPNVDPGSELVMDMIKKFEEMENFKTAKNLSRDIFLCLLKHASAIVGNSSAGIEEAPFFGTPAVNVGNRQAGRERGANVFDVKPDTEEIFNAIQKILNDPGLRERLKAGQNPYAGKGAEKKIVEALAATKVTPEFLLKKLNF